MEGGLYLYEFHPHLKSNIDKIIELKGIPETVIEIGVFQGFFTFNMTGLVAPQNKNYRHFAIDPFDTSPDLESQVISQAFDCFLHNLEVFDYAGNIFFMRQNSSAALMELINKNVQAELIYVDGDHTAPQVLEDLVLAWKLLKPGGIMLCDDSVTWGDDQQVTDTPRLAVDSFLHCYWRKVRVLPLANNWQTAFEKL